jgi:hypothetical protein
MYSQHGGATSAQPTPQPASQPKPQSTTQPQPASQTKPGPVPNSDTEINSMTVQSLLSSVGIKSSNLDDLLEGTVVEVESRVAMIKEKVDENDRKVEEKRAALEIKLNEFNKNLAAQEDLYNFGGGESPSNLFVQLKVHRGNFDTGVLAFKDSAMHKAAEKWVTPSDSNEGSVGYRLRNSLSNKMKGTESWLGIPSLSDTYKLSSRMSKESFLSLLKTTRIFEQETEENTYLAIVKDIQTKRAGGAGGSGGPDVSVINQGLRELQEKYIIQLQQLLNGVGADKPYYTGVRQYAVVGGYETDNREGFLQMPVIMNSKRYNDMKSKSELFLRHETVDDNQRYRGVYMAQPGNANATDLTLDQVRSAHQAGLPAPPNDKTNIIRTTGGNFALHVSRDLGNGHSADDFKLTKPVNLGDVKQIDKDAFEKIVSEQTVYDGGNTPPDVNQSTIQSVVRAVYRGNGTQVAAADASACLAGLIPFDESIFTNLLQEKADGLVQSQTSDGVTDKPIMWRGKSYSLRAGATNSLFGVKDALKSGQDTGSGQVFPKLDKLKDPSETNMITALELEKLCKDFQTKLSECNDGGAGNKGWRGLGWLFTPSQDGQVGGCFNPNYLGGAKNLHLVDSQGKKFIVKTAEGQNGGGLKLENVIVAFGGANVDTSAVANNITAIHTSGGASRNRFDQSRAAYTGNGGGNFLYTRDNPGVDWNAANGGGAATIHDIAEITRRRCILFLFHFLEKAFDAQWYTDPGNGQGLYKVFIDKEEVYKKLSDWDQVEKWWSYTSTAEACTTPDGVVCSYNGEKNPAVAWNNDNPLYPEKLSPQDCLLCFARHLFIGKTNTVDSILTKPRHAHEDEVKVWDIIEEFLPKFYRCALVIKHKETVKDFYTKLETHYTKSSVLSEAKTIKDEKKEVATALQTELLNSYPPDMYRDLMIRMYDKDPQVKEERKRYCCCENEMQPYKGDGQRPNFQQCSICAVAHYFFDIPEARDSYDFKTYGHQQRDVAQEYIAGGTLRFSAETTANNVPGGFNYPQQFHVRKEAKDDFNHVCSDWNEFEWPNGNRPSIFKLDTPGGDNIKGSKFIINVEQKNSKSTAVVAFDKKNNSNKYGIYVANDDTEYSIQLAKHKIQWPKSFLSQTGHPAPATTTGVRIGLDGFREGEYIILKNPDPPDSTLTVKRKSPSQKHCLDGVPPYPIKHLAYKAVIQDEAPLFLDMQSVHGKAKKIIIDFISGWEAKKERYDISKAGAKKEPTPSEGDKSAEGDKPGSTSPGEGATTPGGKQGVTPTSTTGDISSDKAVADSVLPFKEKELDKPSVTSLEQAKSKQVVEFSDYQKLEDEYKRVEREMKRKNELLKSMVAEYRSNNLVQQGDMTENRIKRDSDNKRRILLERRIRDLQRKEKQRLDTLMIAMTRMKKKEEMYVKQMEEMENLKEEKRRSQMEANMHGIVASEINLNHQYQTSLQEAKLRKAQAKYLGLSDKSVHSEYELMRMKSDVKERRNVPHIFSEDKKPKRTQSRKRANKKGKLKGKRTPKKNKKTTD